MPNRNSLSRLAQQLDELSARLATEPLSEVTGPQAKAIRKTLEESFKRLRQAVEDLDPIKHPDFVFDPANPQVAGRIAGLALVAQARHPLEELRKFYGSGVYALYYRGSFKAYEPLSQSEHPIYVGKADPAEAHAKTAKEQGGRLYGRLQDHRRSISKTTNLNSQDFEYRALVVKTGYESTAEKYLINFFRPIWNNETSICYGLGKHGDAPTRRANLRSPWDTLHPGRAWAHSDPTMADQRESARILADISTHLTQHPPILSIDEMLRTFLAEMRKL